jgi:nucleoside-diphosphate-sugar epimerase
VVNCTASGGGGADDYRKIYLEGNRNLIAWLADSPLKKFIFTSSTSVHGQNDGSLVTETSRAEPDADTAKVLVETEKLLLAAAVSSSNPLTPALSPSGGERGKIKSRLPPTFPAVVLRVAGIYGPGRGHWFRQFLRGEARIEGDGTRWLNMIHRDDLIGVIIAALKDAKPGEIFNAVDNEPVSQINFFAWLAAELKQPMPAMVSIDAEVLRKRGATNKQVSNAKLRTKLKYQFQFPDFRAGCAAEIARQKA